MKIQRRTRIFLLAFLVVAPLGILCTGSGEASFLDGEEWICTPAALAKELAGYCGSTMTCRELCYLGEPQGLFSCFHP